MESLIYMAYALIGTLMGSLVAVLPGFHVFNLAAIGAVIFVSFPFVSPLGLACIFIGLLVGWAMVGTIATTFMGAPDDSMRVTVFPNQKYLMYGRGYEASVVTGMGALGSLLLLLVLASFASLVFPAFRKLVTPHTHWILMGIAAYVLQSEWPKDWGSRAKTRLGRLKDGWASLSAGWLVFFLSMMLGFIVLNMPVTPIDKTFQNILPVFIGFVTVPWVLTNTLSRVTIPPQTVSNTCYVSKKDVARGTTSGFLGGIFAAYTPIITAGVGGLLAGHSTATGGDTQFMVSGGAGRFAYFVGAFFLFWVPLLHLIRGGLGWITSMVYQPKTVSEFWLLVAAIAISGVFAFFLLLLFSRAVIKVIGRFDYRKVSFAVLLIAIGIVLFFVGWHGLVIMTIAGGIGLIQVMFRTRWMNMLIGFFFPIFLNMAGVGAAVARFLGVC